MAPGSLDAIDRRIIGALQVDGRASWRRIAAALDEPERTVARRGVQLLESGQVAIHALADPHRTGRGDPFLVRATCAQGSMWSAALALARRPQAISVYALLGSTDCAADLWCPDDQLAEFFLHEMANTPGLIQTSALPIIRYVKTIHSWRTGILTHAEVDGLGEVPLADPWPIFAERLSFSREDRSLMAALASDGRQSFDELGRICGISEQTARRRTEGLRERGILTIRAVFEPRLLGLGVGTLLWIRAHPTAVERVAQTLADSPHVRYCAMLLGDYQIVADLRMPSKAALYSFLTTSEWLNDVTGMETSLIVDMLKQSDVLKTALQPRAFG